MRASDLARELLPPLIGRRLVPTAVTWTGDYQSFAAVRTHTAGYEDGAAVEQAAAVAEHDRRDAERRLMHAQAARHLAMFWPLLAEARGRRVRVLDLGGQTANHLRRMRPWLPPSAGFEWVVWETPAMAAMASARWPDPEVSYVSDPDELSTGWVPDAVLSSGTLQCLPEPAAVFGRLAGLGARLLLIDRFPVWRGGYDRLTIQRVRPPLFSGSFPAWFFAEQPWRDRFVRSGTIVAEWELPEYGEPIRGGRYVGVVLAPHDRNVDRNQDLDGCDATGRAERVLRA